MRTYSIRILAGALATVLTLAPAAAGERESAARHEGTLKAGDEAPDFTLKSPDEKTAFTLSTFKGKMPVVLIFGSYT